MAFDDDFEIYNMHLNDLNVMEIHNNINFANEARRVPFDKILLVSIYFFDYI